MEFDWYQAYQDIVDGGFREGSEFSTNLVSSFKGIPQLVSKQFLN